MIRITDKGSGFIDVLGSYKIYIDDICVGKIKRNETKEFEVGRGKHIIYARSDRYESNSVHVDVNDSIVELEVDYALTGWKRWLFPYSDFTIKKGEYLHLKKKEPVDKQ